MEDRLKQPVATAVLNRVLRILCRSLPMYLDEVKPWVAADARAACLELDRLTSDQRRFARRVAEAIVRHRGQPDPGSFPSQYASFNDVDVAYLLQRIVDGLRADVEVLEHCAAELAISPVACDLAEEVLGNLCGHLELLEKHVPDRA